MGTLVCRIELHKTRGIILTVENPTAQITQTIVMNGESITTTSKGMVDTSTIIQKPDSISIKCKNFNLETENTNCTSTIKTLLKSNLTTEMTALNTSIASTAKTEMKGAQVLIDGTVNTEMKGGAIVKISSNGLLNAEGQLTTVKGQITSIEGSVIKVG
jgi:hypothetical protein